MNENWDGPGSAKRKLRTMRRMCLNSQQVISLKRPKHFKYDINLDSNKQPLSGSEEIGLSLVKDW